MNGKSRTPKSVEARIYRTAAQRLAKMKQTTPACMAIADVAGCGDDLDCLEVRAFTKTFKPRGECGNSAWSWRWVDDLDCDYRKTLDNCRVLALCFMAAMVEAGDA